MKNDFISKLLLWGALSLAAGSVFAHPGHELATGASLMSGLAHPFTGLDHLLAMTAVGAWSALNGRSLAETLRLPAVFVALMMVGFGMAVAGWSLPEVEPMIAASLLVVGLLVAIRARMPAWAGIGIVGGFALFHGYAHGAELPAVTMLSVLTYVTGFIAATALLLGLGAVLGIAARRHTGWLVRVAGVGVALYGVSLLAV